MYDSAESPETVIEPEVVSSAKKRTSGQNLSRTDNGIEHESEYARQVLGIFEERGLGPEGLADAISDEFDRLERARAEGKSVFAHTRATIKLAADLSGHSARVAQKKPTEQLQGNTYNFNGFMVTDNKSAARIAERDGVERVSEQSAG